jgi:hypothetical protein
MQRKLNAERLLAETVVQSRQHKTTEAVRTKRIPNQSFVNAVLVAILSLYAIVWWKSLDRIVAGRIDFMNLYTAGKILISGDGYYLYDIPKQTLVQQSLMRNYVFQGGVLLFIRPPFESIVFLPFGYLSFIVAYCLWVSLMICLACFTIWLLLRLPVYSELRPWSFQIVLATFSFFPVLVSLIQGQDSLMLLFLITWAFTLLKKGQETQAGVILAFSLFKFHLVLPAYLILFVKGKWKVVKGSIYSGFLLFALSIVAVGVQGILGYLKMLSEVTGWTDRFNFNPSKMPNIRGMLTHLLGVHSPFINATSLILTGCIMAAVLMVWKGAWNQNSERFDLQFSLTLMAGLLAGHYLYSHDQSMLVLPFFILLMIAQRVGGAVRTGISLLIAVANPATIIPVAEIGRFHLPINAIYLLLLFASMLYLSYLLPVPVSGSHDLEIVATK